MRKTLKQIADLIAGEVVGDPGVVITGVSGIKEARAGDITFLANDKYLALADKTQASAIIVSGDIKITCKPSIRAENASLAFAKVVNLAVPSEIKRPRGIHPSALLAKNVKLGKNTAIAAYCVVEEGASIGDNSVLYPGCFIGRESKIGNDALIYVNVSVRERTLIGDRVIIHSGTVIGSDGFGFIEISGAHHKIPQVGIVEIGDDVEIGANVTIDRARFDKTVIGKGTKIDNLVQIAHNVVIGENCLIVAQAGISGSTSLGKNVTLAGQVGLVGHIHIGDNSVIAAQSGITKSVPPGTVMFGYPAKPHAVAKKINACVANLPRMYKVVNQLKIKIKELEKKIEGK